MVCNTILLTLKALLLPSTATATGPVLATAAWRLASLPLLMDTLPEILAPRRDLSYLHEPCCVWKVP